MECYRIAEAALVFNSKYNGVREVSVNAFYVDSDTGILRLHCQGTRQRAGVAFRPD